VKLLRKRRKAPGLSGLSAEMIQATEGIGTQWLFDLCNGIVKEGCIPEDWKSSVILPIYKAKGDPMECVSYTTTTTAISRPFFRDHPGELVPEENFWTL